MLGYLINFGMVLLAEMHQSIHDKTAKTLVVERKVEMPRISIDQRTYNISGGQLVVTGDNPVLTGVQLGDVNFSKSLIDFANELAKVRVKVEEQSPSEERNIATAILNAAEADANRDDIPKIKERLSMLGTKIGKWVYDFAVEVGANLVAESIIRLNGLK
jgi:hypothetical protein